MTQVFLVGVKGESFPNADGTSRQDIIRCLRKGEQVQLVPEPTNPHDRWAVKVLTQAGQQIGWLPSDARDASTLMRGEPLVATVHDIRGGTNWLWRLMGKKYVGVVLRVEKQDVDWSRWQRLMELAQPYDKQVTDALALEEAGKIDEAIAAYRQAIADISTFTHENPRASAHRYQYAPVDRLSLLLERRGLYAEALAALTDWIQSNDPVQPNRSVADSMRKRMARLTKRTP